ncbi:hypothetical protein ACTTAM_06600 [Rhodobacter capsulatus]|uniref:hypothetical protein n=1 Tax=Rhodobacter capsulatus TaxID=1061 RepID=UPI004026058C
MTRSCRDRGAAEGSAEVTAAKAPCALAVTVSMTSPSSSSSTLAPGATSPASVSAPAG